MKAKNGHSLTGDEAEDNEFPFMWNSSESKETLLVRHKDLELEKASRWVMSQRCKQHYGFTLRGLLEE